MGLPKIDQRILPGRKFLIEFGLRRIDFHDQGYVRILVDHVFSRPGPNLPLAPRTDCQEQADRM